MRVSSALGLGGEGTSKELKRRLLKCFFKKKPPCALLVTGRMSVQGVCLRVLLLTMTRDGDSWWLFD